MSVLFKTTFMGGYDKDDVQAKYSELETELEKIKEELKAQAESHKEEVLELKNRIRSLEAEKTGLETEIRDTYQPYKDNYESISKLVYQSQLQAEKILAQAKTESDSLLRTSESDAEQMLSTAREDCEAMRRTCKEECEKRRADSVAAAEKIRQVSESEAEKRIAAADVYLKKHMHDFHQDIDARLEDAREGYRTVYSELEQLTEVLDGTQKSFREVFRKVHTLKDEMEASAQNMEAFQPNYPSEEQVLEEVKSMLADSEQKPDQEKPDQENSEKEEPKDASVPVLEASEDDCSEAESILTEETE